MPGDKRNVSAALAETIIALRPSIVSHACKSTGTGFFGAHIAGATLPHTVEHLAIDLLVERFSKDFLSSASDDNGARRGHASSPTFAGATTWLDRATGCMRVRVGCTSSDPADYLKATEDALVDAVALMNRLLADFPE